MFRTSLIFLLFGILVSGEVKSEIKSEAKPASKAKLVVERPNQKTEKTARRQGLLFDYNSWFENIRILGGTPYDTKALLYGLGLSYEYTLLHITWGW